MKGSKTAMKNKVSLAIVVASLVLLPACGPIDWIKNKFGMKKSDDMISVSTSDDGLVNEGEVLVSMNGKSIVSTASLEREFDILLEENPQLKSVLPMMPDAKFNFMQGMISQAVVDQYVAEKGIDQTEAYKQDMARMMRSVRRMLNTKYFGLEHAVEVADADVEKYYNDNKETMPDLMISRGGVQACGVAFAKEDAAKAFAVKAQGRNFARAAKEAGMADKMRDFKMVNAQSVGMDNAVKNKIIAMRKFPSTEVMKGDDNMFWVVNATEKQEATYRPLEQVRAGLKQYMEKEKRMAMFDKEISQLKESYKVAVNDNYFKAQNSMQMADQSDAMPAAAPAQAA